ncbi:MAG: hypothetical protein EOO57_04225 [Hymenobacter sp.]|nr:MAG: hypothetical protein EOO57_04225 [Hymenobacter sp.]
MKSFAKLGLLLALVVVGRYFRPAEYAALPAQKTDSVTLVKHDTLQFATYATSQTNLVAPVNQRSRPSRPLAANEEYSIWY